MENRHDLFSMQKNGKLRRWSIWSDGDFICMEYGEIGGEFQENSEPIHFGLAGRTKEEQIAMRVNSRVNKKLTFGYHTSQAEATVATKQNLLGYARPMKAVPLKSETQVPYGDLFVQHKYDGHRCMIVNDAGNNIAYSNGGKIIESIPEILGELDIPEGIILDGELYHHGSPLQTISSWVRRKQENSQRLKFICFDAVMDGTFEKRYSFLSDFDFGKRSELAWTARLYGEFNILPILGKALEDGYEGLMLRMPHSEYLSGQRDKSAIMKVKRNMGNNFIFDDEFLVTNIKSSADKWAVLCCETESGIPFNISAPGTVQEKTHVLQHKEKYIGCHVRVEFLGYTKAKKPFHASAIGWREKHHE